MLRPFFIAGTKAPRFVPELLISKGHRSPFIARRETTKAITSYLLHAQLLLDVAELLHQEVLPLLLGDLGLHLYCDGRRAVCVCVCMRVCVQGDEQL